MSDLTYVGELMVVTCWCGMRHAVPEELRNFQMRKFENGESAQAIYCPLGHTHVPAGEGKAKRLERQLSRERASHDQTRAALRAQKAATTRLKRRGAHGVCPCCKRTFKQLARHMKVKHPDYVAENE